jgi:hypothetical protein
VHETGYTLADLRAFVATRRDLRGPIQHIPHHSGFVGRAATFALQVGELMRREGVAPRTASGVAPRAVSGVAEVAS